MKKLSPWIVRAVVLFFSLIALMPFYIMVIMGTHLSEDLLTTLQLLPGGDLAINFANVMKTNFLLFYRNSLYTAILSTLGCVAVSGMAGFAFAKYRFKGKRFLFGAVLATLMIPMQLGLVGLMMQLKSMGLMNTHFALIVPPMANAFTVFWMTQYIKSAVPTEILESARMDGCGDFVVFWRIVFPICRPANITVFLLSFLASWNNYLTPLVVINKEELYTVPLGATLFSTTYRNDYGAQTLALTLATIPVIILFAFGSKYLIQGLASGGVKE